MLRAEGGSERGSCRDNAGGAGWLATVYNRVLLRIEVDLSWEVNYENMNGCSLDFVEVEPCKDGVLSGLKQETPGNYYGFHLVRRVKGEANIKH